MQRVATSKSRLIVLVRLTWARWDFTSAFAIAVMSAFMIAGCSVRSSAILDNAPLPAPAETRGASFRERGEASYYAGSLQSHKTASGELYDGAKLTAAHRTLPFGTIVKVTNFANSKSVSVRINDRGPFSKSRIIDLSSSAAVAIGMQHDGVAQVELVVAEHSRLEPGSHRD